jgi:hypothetical protein
LPHPQTHNHSRILTHQTSQITLRRINQSSNPKPFFHLRSPIETQTPAPCVNLRGGAAIKSLVPATTTAIGLALHAIKHDGNGIVRNRIEAFNNCFRIPPSATQIEIESHFNLKAEFNNKQQRTRIQGQNHVRKKGVNKKESIHHKCCRI